MLSLRQSENNRSGREFEEQLQSHLKAAGFWACKLKTGTYGTAFDVIAVKGDRALAFECKHVKEPYYSLSKLTANEQDGIPRYLSRGNTLLLTLGYEGRIYVYPYKFITPDMKSVRVQDCVLLGIFLDNWEAGRCG